MKRFIASGEAMLCIATLSALLFLASVIMVGYYPEKELTHIILIIAFFFSASLTVGVGTSFGRKPVPITEVQHDHTARLYASKDHPGLHK